MTRRHGYKLSVRWQGPYKIIGKVSPVTYMVDMPERGKRLRTVYVEILKSWVESTKSILQMRTQPEECGDIPDYHHIQMDTLDPNRCLAFQRLFNNVHTRNCSFETNYKRAKMKVELSKMTNYYRE